jgi:hypothetical protein
MSCKLVDAHGAAPCLDHAPGITFLDAALRPAGTGHKIRACTEFRQLGASRCADKVSTKIAAALRQIRTLRQR